LESGGTSGAGEVDAGTETDVFGEEAIVAAPGANVAELDVELPATLCCIICSISVTSLSSLNCASCETNWVGSMGLVGS